MNKKEFIEALYLLWVERTPEMRFGQFIHNIQTQYYQETSKDIFYLSDKTLIDLIDNYTQNWKRVSHEDSHC